MPHPILTRRYARQLSAVFAALLVADEGADPVAAGGGPGRWLSLLSLAARLGKPPGGVDADFAVLAAAARYRRTIAESRLLARVLALYVRLLRKCAAAARDPAARRTARRLLAAFPTSRACRHVNTARRRAKMARRGLKRLEGERPELLIARPHRA